jgi:SET domain-containing protein
VQIVRQWLPSQQLALRVNIDATRRGNAARFANHRCGDANCDLVLVTQAGRLLPRVALVAHRAVAAGEELTFSYGAPRSLAGQGRQPGEGAQACLCGSAACLGGLPLQT